MCRVRSEDERDAESAGISPSLPMLSYRQTLDAWSEDRCLSAQILYVCVSVEVYVSSCVVEGSSTLRS